MKAHPSINLPEAISLWPDSKTPGFSQEDGPFPRLTYYLPSDEYRTGQSILILPGGGYGLVSSAKEGHRPAQYLASHGIATAVLEYRHAPSRFPIPLFDAQRAMRWIRQRALDNALNPEQIGVLGFSAGGHLAGLLATLEPREEGIVGDSIDKISCCPNFGALIYPVVSFVTDYAHGRSAKNLLGENFSDTLAASLSLEKTVNESTPPMFIVHEQYDPTCSSEGVLDLYKALTKSGVKATLHLYEGDKHGFGLAANHPWGKALLGWLDQRRA